MINFSHAMQIPSNLHRGVTLVNPVTTTQAHRPISHLLQNTGDPATMTHRHPVRVAKARLARVARVPREAISNMFGWKVHQTAIGVGIQKKHPQLRFGTGHPLVNLARARVANLERVRVANLERALGVPAAASLVRAVVNLERVLGVPVVASLVRARANRVKGQSSTTTFG